MLMGFNSLKLRTVINLSKSLCSDFRFNYPEVLILSSRHKLISADKSVCEGYEET